MQIQLNCPQCGQPVAAEHINIQKMVAVCPSCNTIFSFDTPAPKTKRRKVKQPEHLDLRDTEDRLHMSFRTNFRLDRNESFAGAATGSAVMTFLSIIITGGYIERNVPLIIPIIFSLIALAFYYWAALIVYNKTHIDMTDDLITVSRSPLPSPFNQSHTVNLAGVTDIRCEETPISKTEGYDTPRYTVWAHMPDGTRRMIVNDVVDDYGFFIAQRLQERLEHEGEIDDRDADVSRLTTLDALVGGKQDDTEYGYANSSHQVDNH